ncbi:MAG: MarR family transcriptional regulator [Bryobacteraceae bacterium]
MPSGSRVDAFLRLSDECVALFHTLRAAAEQVHGQGELSAARRGILRSLANSGPQTVPQMARARQVSRQHIQIVVNGLLEDGLVRPVSNPAHKRSSLIQLTTPGRKKVEAMAAAERRLLAELRLPSSAAMNQAAETLAAVRSII